MSVIRDLSGQKFGRLTALYPTENVTREALYIGTVSVNVEMK